MKTDRTTEELALLEHALEFLIPKFRESHEIIVSMLDFPRSQELRFADLGSGFGELSKRLLLHFPAALVFGIDDKRAIMEKTRASLKEFDGRFIGFERNLQNISWTEGLAPLDAVASSFTLDYLPEQEHQRIISDAYHVLNPLGRWVSCEFYQATDARVNRIFHDLEIQYVQNSMQKGELTREQVDRLSRSTLLRQKHHVCRLDEKMDWLRQAGFKNVDVPWRFLNLAVVSGVK